jgi:hypothetical protein
MLDPLTAAEIQALRLKLHLFISQQTDKAVRSQCFAVDAKLAELLEGDDPILRQVQANSVEQLEEALRWAARSTIEKGCGALSYRASPPPLLEAIAQDQSAGRTGSRSLIEAIGIPEQKFSAI